MNRSLDKLKRKKTEFSVCLSSSHLNVFYHSTATVINQCPLLGHVATDLSKALHRTPSSSNMQNYKVILLVSFMSSIFFLLFPDENPFPRLSAQASVTLFRFWAAGITVSSPLVRPCLLFHGTAGCGSGRPRRAIAGSC